MSGSVNQVFLLGRLGRDPEVRHLSSGTAVTDVSIATERTWYDKQTKEKKSETCWTEVTFWGRTAEIASQYLTKGEQVHVRGHLKLDEWSDKDTGQKRSKLKVVCDEMTLIGRNTADQSAGQRQSGEQNQAQPAWADAANNFPAATDDVPF